MICRELIKTRLVQRAYATKRIRIEVSQIEKIVDTILDHLDTINSLPEFSSMCWGKPLDTILVANEWKDLILPESVRLDPTDLKNENLLVKPTALVTGDISTYISFLDAQLAFRSIFKKDMATDTTTVATLRQPKSLFDVLPVAMFGDDNGEVDSPSSLRSIDEPFIPVKLVPEIKALFRSDYLNANTHYIINDYFAKYQF